MALITLGANAITALPSGVGGKVLQVVSENFKTAFQQTINSSSPQTLNDGTNNVDIAITPSSASNKILVSFNLGRVTGANTSTGYGTLFKIQRNGSDITNATGTGVSSEDKGTFFHGTENLSYASGITFSFLDEPNTTSECTYSLLVYSHSTNNYVLSFNRYYTTTGVGGYRGSTIIDLQAMEIAG